MLNLLPKGVDVNDVGIGQGIVQLAVQGGMIGQWTLCRADKFHRYPPAEMACATAGEYPLSRNMATMVTCNPACTCRRQAGHGHARPTGLRINAGMA